MEKLVLAGYFAEAAHNQLKLIGPRIGVSPRKRTPENHKNSFKYKTCLTTTFYRNNSARGREKNPFESQKEIKIIHRGDINFVGKSVVVFVRVRVEQRRETSTTRQTDEKCSQRQTQRDPNTKEQERRDVTMTSHDVITWRQFEFFLGGTSRFSIE